MKSQKPQPQPQEKATFYPTEFANRIRADERAKTLQEVYEKAYKLDWSEDAFVIWLEAELKEIK